MPGRLLDCRPATEVEVAAGHCGRTAGRRGTFQHHYPGAGGGCRDRSAAPADPEPDDHHIELIGTVGERVDTKGCGEIQTAHSDEDIAGPGRWLEHVLV